MDKKELNLNELEAVTGGAKTIVDIDDNKMAEGGMKMEIEGELVTLRYDGANGFYCTVNGRELWFSTEEIAAMLHEQLK